jgi:regulator of protease activity HflC (stomatin/prohibitin superfamily)
VAVTHHAKEIREATLLEIEQYAVVKERLSGHWRHEVGPQHLFLGPYDELIEVRDKIVLRKGEYARLMDRSDGTERVMVGPQTIVPAPMETIPQGVEEARLLEVETALLVEDRATGRRRLVTEAGVYIPNAYEDIVEERHLIHVLPHEAVVVRDSQGQLVFHSGTEGNGVGTAFFLEPYHEIVEMHWSDYSQPPAAEEELDAMAVLPPTTPAPTPAAPADATTNDTARLPTPAPTLAPTPLPQPAVARIDMRARRMYFQYEVRTSDNVKLTLEGTVFWRIRSLPTVINATRDPEGDVWHHARSALIEGVSNATLQRFMSGFNGIVMDAFRRQALDGFYAERGVEMLSMGVTRFDCADPETAAVLQQIIQETTNRINRLTAQESENEVRAAALTANITLERQRTELIRTQSENHRLQSQMQGEAEGQQLVRTANAFIGGLNESVPEVESRVELYRLHEELRSRNTDTGNLASGSAHLFLTPQDLNLRLDTHSPSALEL